MAFASLSWLNRTQQATAYGGAAFFFEDRQQAAVAVELERRDSRAPNWIETLYLNKYAYWARTFVRHYLYAFSPQYLFLNQEGNGIYAVWFRGQFYLIEAPLMLLGWLYLATKKRRAWWLLNGLALIAPLPSALGVGDPSYTMRSILLLPILTLLAAAGIVSLKDLIGRNKKLLLLTSGALTLIYFTHLGGYLTQYYYDWWRVGARYYSYDTKQMIDVVTEEIAAGRRVIVAPAASNIFLQWIFYQKRDPARLSRAFFTQQFTDGALTMLRTCLTAADVDPRTQLPQNTVYIAQKHCHVAIPDRTLSDLEGNTSWHIYDAIK